MLARMILPYTLPASVIRAMLLLDDGTKAAVDGVHYSNSVQSMEWSSHADSECGVSTAGLKIIE